VYAYVYTYEYARTYTCLHTRATHSQCHAIGLGWYAYVPWRRPPPEPRDTLSYIIRIIIYYYMLYFAYRYYMYVCTYTCVSTCTHAWHAHELTNSCDARHVDRDREWERETKRKSECGRDRGIIITTTIIRAAVPAPRSVPAHERLCAC
jgi:hypothetical protein